MPNENLSKLIINLQKEFRDFRKETNEHFNEVYSKLDNHTQRH